MHFKIIPIDMKVDIRSDIMFKGDTEILSVLALPPSHRTSCSQQQDACEKQSTARLLTHYRRCRWHTSCGRLVPILSARHRTQRYFPAERTHWWKPVQQHALKGAAEVNCFAKHRKWQNRNRIVPSRIFANSFILKNKITGDQKDKQEISVYVFVFADLVLFTQPSATNSNDTLILMRNIGISKILVAADVSGQQG